MEESERCAQGPHRNEVDAQTRRVRYLDRDGRERMTAGMCGRHASIVAAQYRQEGYKGVWTVPASRSPRPARDITRHVRMIEVTSGMVKTYRMATRTMDTDGMILTGLTVALFGRYLEETKIPKLHPINLDPYPGTVAELAEEFARVVTDLEESGTARGILLAVLGLLETAALREGQRQASHATGVCGACPLPRHGITNRCNQCPERSAGSVPPDADVAEYIGNPSWCTGHDQPASACVDREGCVL